MLLNLLKNLFAFQSKNYSKDINQIAKILSKHNQSIKSYSKQSKQIIQIVQVLLFQLNWENFTNNHINFLGLNQNILHCRSLEGPESIIFDKKMNSGQESTELTIRQQQVEELPLQSQNDVIMQINHLHSIFKYLQTEDTNSKISTKTNSQHSIIKSKDVENKPTSQNRIQSKNISQQIKRDHSPNRISIRTNICQTTRQNCQQSKSPSYRQFLLDS